MSFIKGDICDLSAIELRKVDTVVHLAAIVGDPACAKNARLAEKVNLDATINLIDNSKKNNIERFVFISTCSNYGKMSENENYVSENSQLAPVSLYANLKVKAEEYILNNLTKTNDFNPTVLRFATAYGLSPRPRFDLTVNEFVKELTLKRKLKVFGEQFWRPYCHVYDLARAILTVINFKKEEIKYNVYNVGNTEEKLSKDNVNKMKLKRLYQIQMLSI